jgi:hypothetical protein
MLMLEQLMDKLLQMLEMRIMDEIDLNLMK